MDVVVRRLGDEFQTALPGVTGEALQFFLQPLVVGTVLECAFVGEVGVARFGVQRVELIDVVLGPSEEVAGRTVQVHRVRTSRRRARRAARR